MDIAFSNPFFTLNASFAFTKFARTARAFRSDFTAPPSLPKFTAAAFFPMTVTLTALDEPVKSGFALDQSVKMSHLASMPSPAQLAYFPPAKSPKTRPDRSTAQQQVDAMQRVLAADVLNPKTKPSVRAQVASAYERLERLRRAMKGLADPRPYVADGLSNAKRVKNRVFDVGASVQEAPGTVSETNATTGGEATPLAADAARPGAKAPLPEPLP